MDATQPTARFLEWFVVSTHTRQTQGGQRKTDTAQRGRTTICSPKIHSKRQARSARSSKRALTSRNWASVQPFRAGSDRVRRITSCAAPATASEQNTATETSRTSNNQEQSAPSAHEAEQASRHSTLTSQTATAGTRASYSAAYSATTACRARQWSPSGADMKSDIVRVSSLRTQRPGVMIRAEAEDRQSGLIAVLARQRTNHRPEHRIR